MFKGMTILAVLIIAMASFVAEVSQATTPTEKGGYSLKDSDGDGVNDFQDNCKNIANPGQEDLNKNGIGDACENSDADGIVDAEDNCPEVYNPNQLDTDKDGVGDACDNCRLVSNPGQEDVDKNDVGDACEADYDGDKVPNDQDNCVKVANPDQADSDNDGIGDACEVDVSTSTPIAPIPGEGKATGSSGCSLSGGQGTGIFGFLLSALYIAARRIKGAVKK